MNDQPSAAEEKSLKPLRIWIPVILILLMVVARFTPGIIEDGPTMIWMLAAFGPMLLSFAVLLWWLFASRATGLEKILGLLGVLAAFGTTLAFIHPSMQGPAVMVLTIPVGTAAFALTLIAMSRVLSRKRTLAAVVMACLGFGSSTLLQSDGMWGNFAIGLDWRWNPTPEDQFLANQKSAPERDTVDLGDEFQQALSNPEWPEFRGSRRDGVQHGTQITADWEASPPEELWRIQVGPAWSSFAVAGRWLFTQEQRGELETTVCYDADTGAEVWARGFESRFSDPLGGPGPRATPTLADGSLFTMGAEGWLMRLDAQSGDIQWKVDLREVAGRDPPIWGFSSSPLVTDGVVVVHAGGESDKGILAFDSENGQLTWSAAAGPDSYGSLQIVHVAQQPWLAILTNTGAHLLDASDGSTGLSYEWAHQGYRVLQPQVVGDNGLLIPTGMGKGTRLIEIQPLSESATDSGEVQSVDVWTSRNMKPDFNDLVVHQGHMYGFDGAIFACVDLSDGSRIWKKGRYGKGQVLLLADSDLLLVISETGEIVLLEASPTGHQELAKLQALEGKTWNHPVVVGDRLYLRNAREAAAYRLPVSASSTNDNPDSAEAVTAL